MENNSKLIPSDRRFISKHRWKLSTPLWITNQTATFRWRRPSSLYISDHSDVCVEWGTDPHPHLHLHCPAITGRRLAFQPVLGRWVTSSESQELLLSLKYSTLAAGDVPLAKKAKPTEWDSSSLLTVSANIFYSRNSDTLYSSRWLNQ